MWTDKHGLHLYVASIYKASSITNNNRNSRRQEASEYTAAVSSKSIVMLFTAKIRRAQQCFQLMNKKSKLVQILKK